MKPKTAVFIADPLARFDRNAETTFYLMEELCARGWECRHALASDLAVEDSVPLAHTRRLHVSSVPDPLKEGQRFFSFEIQDEARIDLTRATAVFPRKDPPVDQAYTDHLSLLEFLKGHTLLFNSARGIKAANEKILPLHFKGLSPPTLVACDKRVIVAFARQHRTVILKPLGNAGGRGIVKVQSGDESLGSLIEMMTGDGTGFIMAQKYIPAARLGDKRIMLLDGRILGWFLRVPGKGDFRGNLHSGGSLKACQLTASDLRIVRRIAPRLRDLGLHFAGLDIIGEFVTEINVTSPMGIREIVLTGGPDVTPRIVDWIERRCR